MQVTVVCLRNRVHARLLGWGIRYYSQPWEFEAENVEKIEEKRRDSEQRRQSMMKRASTTSRRPSMFDPKLKDTIPYFTPNFQPNDRTLEGSFSAVSAAIFARQ